MCNLQPNIFRIPKQIENLCVNSYICLGSVTFIHLCRGYGEELTGQSSLLSQDLNKCVPFLSPVLGPAGLGLNSLILTNLTGNMSDKCSEAQGGCVWTLKVSKRLLRDTSKKARNVLQRPWETFWDVKRQHTTSMHLMLWAWPEVISGCVWRFSDGLHSQIWLSTGISRIKHILCSLSLIVEEPG